MTENRLDLIMPHSTYLLLKALIYDAKPGSVDNAAPVILLGDRGGHWLFAGLFPD